MRDKEQSRYLKIGVFVLLCTGLIVVGIIIFGSFHLFERRLYVETYFNESVQGLAIGSPVKYRGIDIGRVQAINFVSNIYNVSHKDNKYARYIYVLLSLKPNFLKDMKDVEMKGRLEHSVKDGLRIKLALLDLTGNAYVELNFTNPRQNPVLPINWKPKHYYVPSTQSILLKFTDSIQGVLQGLQDVNFPDFFNNIQTLAKSTNEAMMTIDKILDRTQGSVVRSMRNTAAITRNVNQLTASVKSNPSQLLFSKPAVIDPARLQ
jgi:ABC-type transporter Mla subunit MlaD